jgi:hypothetical protein
MLISDESRDMSVIMWTDSDGAKLDLIAHS